MELRKSDPCVLEDRIKMVERQLKARGLKDERVLEAFLKVRRDYFVPDDLSAKAYEDNPLPIGSEQTISQPYIVALMTELLEIKPEDRVLEIGTGSGYQTAILAELSNHVYSVEIRSGLYQKAKQILRLLGYLDVHLCLGNGREGWREHAPFDKILVAAAGSEIPQALMDQMAAEAKIVMPVGFGNEQDLVLGRKENNALLTKPIIPVRFVPLVLEAA